MADAVSSEYLYSGHRRKVLHLTNLSDGTGESGVVKADISTLTFNFGAVPTYTNVLMIDYNIQGFSSVRLHWDHDTDDEITILPAGQGCIDWNAVGGKTDPRSAGGTGDIILTTEGETAGASYDLTVYFLPKA